MQPYIDTIIMTFATVSLDAIQDMLFEAGWQYTSGTRYVRKGMAARLKMNEAGDGYVLVAA